MLRNRAIIEFKESATLKPVLFSLAGLGILIIISLSLLLCQFMHLLEAKNETWVSTPRGNILWVYRLFSLLFYYTKGSPSAVPRPSPTATG